MAAHPADRMDWCPKCEAPSVILDIETQSVGHEEQEQTIGVVALACGHYTFPNTNQEI